MNKMKPYSYRDDAAVVPESVKKMSLEELDAEIARLEAEARAEKERLERQPRASA